MSQQSETLPETRAERGPERRAAIRYVAGHKGSCKPVSTRRQASLPACIRDISTSGAGIILGRRFEPGTLLVIELSDAEPGGPTLLGARVVRAQPQADRKWLLGCELMGNLAEHELEDLIRSGRPPA